MEELVLLVLLVDSLYIHSLLKKEAATLGKPIGQGPLGSLQLPAGKKPSPLYYPQVETNCTKKLVCLKVHSSPVKLLDKSIALLAQFQPWETLVEDTA